MESVVALFPDPRQAQVALEALQSRGFERERLAFAMTDVVAENDLAQITGVSPEAGAPAGAAGVIRGSLLGLAGGLAMTTPIWILLLIVPSTRIFADGGLAGMLFGALGGLGLGGLFGALSGTDHGDYVKLLRRLGVPAVQAEKFYDGMKNGYVMVIARDPDGARADEAMNIMRRNGAAKLDDAFSRKNALQSERGTQTDH